MQVDQGEEVAKGLHPKSPRDETRRLKEELNYVTLLLSTAENMLAEQDSLIKKLQRSPRKPDEPPSNRPPWLLYSTLILILVSTFVLRRTQRS